MHVKSANSWDFDIQNWSYLWSTLGWELGWCNSQLNGGPSGHPRSPLKVPHWPTDCKLLSRLRRRAGINLNFAFPSLTSHVSRGSRISNIEPLIEISWLASWCGHGVPIIVGGLLTLLGHSRSVKSYKNWAPDIFIMHYLMRRNPDIL